MPWLTNPNKPPLIVTHKPFKSPPVSLFSRTQIKLNMFSGRSDTGISNINTTGKEQSH
jgi:hypothetical protein